MRKGIAGIALGIFCCLGVVFYTRENINKVRVDDKVYNTKTLEQKLQTNLNKGNPVFIGEGSKAFNLMVSYKVNAGTIKDRSFFDKLKDLYTAKVYKVGKEIKFRYTVDRGILSAYIAKYNKGVNASEDACLIRGRKSYSIQKEKLGKQIDISPLLKDLDNQKTGLKLSSYYIKPNVISSDLKGVKNKLNKYVSWSCTYKNGVKIKADINSVNYTKQKIELDVDWLRNSMIKVLGKFNTVGNSRKFKIHSGKKIKVSGGTWGSVMNADKELKYLISKFKKVEVIKNRVPYYEVSHDKIGKTYIEVSLDKQTVWYYKKGKCKMSSPCVTGNVSLGHGTPRGIYYISERVNGKYLTGDGYKTWVNKWMRLTNMGVGLHDAYWRGYFGGSIYRTNGSHGCINLPSSFASKLYDIAYVGMPVIIY